MNSPSLPAARPLPDVIHDYVNRGRVREVRGGIITPSGTLAVQEGEVHPSSLLHYIVGKSIYVSVPSLGMFDALLKHLPLKLLQTLPSRRWLPYREYWLRYSADRTDAHLTARFGNEYGTISNIYALCGDASSPEAIESRVRRAMTAFDSEKLPYGDLRTPGHVAATVMKSGAGLSTLPLPEHQQRFLDSYRGARFETTRFGVHNVHDYDIHAAYPSIMARMPDTGPMEWRDSTDTDLAAHADYAAILCDVHINEALHRSPVAYRIGYEHLYWPVGRFTCWLNLPEIRLLLQYPDLGRIERVHCGSWGVPVVAPSTPFRRAMEALYRLRRTAELDSFVKQVMVCCYGKTIALNDNNGKLEANALWNPVYASHITAELRCRAYELSMSAPTTFGEYADGVTVDRALPESDGMGGLRREGAGPMLFISDHFKEGEWKRPAQPVRFYMHTQREATEVTIPVAYQTTMLDMTRRNLEADAIGVRQNMSLHIPLGSLVRIHDVHRVQAYDILDGQVESRPPTVKEAESLAAMRKLLPPMIGPEMESEYVAI